MRAGFIYWGLLILLVFLFSSMCALVFIILQSLAYSQIESDTNALIGFLVFTLILVSVLVFFLFQYYDSFAGALSNLKFKRLSLIGAFYEKLRKRARISNIDPQIKKLKKGVDYFEKEDD